MRKWIDLVKQQLNEAERPTQTRERIPLGIDVAPDSLGAVAPKNAADVAVPGIRSNKRPSVHASLSGDDMAHLANLHAAGLEDELGDAGARRNAGFDEADPFNGGPAGMPPPPPPVENLPAVINPAVMGGNYDGSTRFDPEWHQVKHLPGYIQQGIRAMGRMVFRPFTDTPIEDIQVLSTLTNPEYDVKRMAAWITRNGIEDDAAELHFNEIMPGYSSAVKVYNTLGYQFMIVHDHKGYYIYGYNGGRGVHLGGRDAPRLEGLDEETAARLKGLAELANPLKTQYERFMEGDVPDFLSSDDGDDDTQTQPNGQAAAPAQQGSGQSNSTTKPVAPGQTPQATPTQSAPATPSGPPPVLNAAQAAAKAKADAAQAAANNPQN